MPTAPTSDRRPKLLLLSQVLPYPPDTGVAVRAYNTLRILAKRFDVTLLAFSRKAAHPSADDRARGAEGLAELARTQAFVIPQEHSRVRYIADHLRSLLTRTPYTRYAYDSEPFRAALREGLSSQRWDIVQLESLDLFGYLDEIREEVPVVVVHHNVESQLLARRAEVASNPVSRWYLRHQARLLEREERRRNGSVDLNIAVSQPDADLLKSFAPDGDYVVAPNGVDTEFFSPPPNRPAERNGVVFIGGTEWLPNKDGLDFFCNDILPLLRDALPDLPVTWVGRSSEEEQEQYREQYDITLTGYVDDVRPYIANAHCSVVPLRFGGGTRLKITTAWAMGSAVVSTTVGCEGLATEDGHNILIRDRPDEFALAIVEIVRDHELRDDMEEEARATAVRRYSWDVIAGHMIPAYEALITAE